MKRTLSFLMAALCLAAFVPQQLSAQWIFGSGTSSDPYLINTTSDLVQLATNVDGGIDYVGQYFRLEVDLDLNIFPYNTGTGWGTIGENTAPFRGTFDGNKKVIRNLFINNTFFSYCGLFGCIDGGAVYDLGLENVSITGNVYLGGVAGQVRNGGSIRNCYVTGTISGSRIIGGVVGQVNNNSRVTNCYSPCTVSSDNTSLDHIGGVAGEVNSSSVTNCVALNPSINTVPSTNYGRVVGYNNANSATLNNIAWSGMRHNGAPAVWQHIGATDLDGDSISSLEIHLDGTLGGRFLPADGWAIADGKLPGYGTPVDISQHLKVSASPADLMATADNGQASLSWAPPASNGSNPVTGYEYSVGTSSGAESWTAVPSSGSSTVSHTVDGLTNDTQYYFKVRAVNDAGSGFSSNEATAMPVYFDDYDLDAAPNCPPSLVGVAYILPCGGTVTVATGTDGTATPGGKVDLSGDAQIIPNGDREGHTVIRPGPGGAIVTLPDGTEIRVPSDGAIIIDPAVPYGLRVATLPSLPIIMRLVTLHVPDGVISQPAAGDYYVRSGEDFDFKLTFTQAQQTGGLPPVVKTDRLIVGEQEVLKGVPNGDGSYTFTVRRIRQEVEVTVVTDAYSDVSSEAIAPSHRVWSHGNRLYISADKPSVVCIYTLAGTLHSIHKIETGDANFFLARGVYAVEIDGIRRKVIITN